MEHALKCNNLKCRKELLDKALITSCDHIFCLNCARRVGLVGQDSKQHSICPACNAQLLIPDSIAINNLNPHEDYKTRVLAGLSPNIIMQCADRALNLWTFQMAQDIYYQQYLNKSLTERCTNIQREFERTINDANMEIEALQNKLTSLSSERDALRRKNEDAAQFCQEKERKLLQVQELYDKVKMKVEMDHLQRAASDKIDSTMRSAPQGIQGPRASPSESNTFANGNYNQPVFGQPQRTRLGHLNTTMPRSNPSPRPDAGWPRIGGSPHSTTMNNPRGQRVEAPSFFESSNLGGPAGRRNPESVTQNIALGYGSKRHVGLISGMKIGQPDHNGRAGAFMWSH